MNTIEEKVNTFEQNLEELNHQLQKLQEAVDQFESSKKGLEENLNKNFSSIRDEIGKVNTYLEEASEHINLRLESLEVSEKELKNLFKDLFNRIQSERQEQNQLYNNLKWHVTKAALGTATIIVITGIVLTMIL